VRGLDLLIGVPILWFVELVLGILLLCWTGLSLSDYPVAVLVMSLLGACATVLVSWLLVCRKYGMGFFEGFRLSRPSGRTVRRCVLVAALCAVIGASLQERFSTGQSLLARMTETPTGFVCVVLLALLLPPVEELYYRGFIFPALRRKIGGVAATVVVALWFAGVHAFQQNGDWIVLPIIAVVGAIWTVQRLVSDALTASMITHWAYNATLVLLALVAKALE